MHVERENSNKIQWACRRGMLELDVLLGNFYREAYPTLNANDQALFVDLLKCQDQDLFNWLTGSHLTTLSQFTDMILAIRQHAKDRHKS